MSFSKKKPSQPEPPPPEEMLFVTLSQPSEPSSFKYRTALSEQWSKIGPIKGTIDFLLTNDYNFSKNNSEVMSWNILGPALAADGFAASLNTDDDNEELKKVTNNFKTALDSVEEAVANDQKYAIYAHYIVLGEKWRHYTNGTFYVNREEGGEEKDGALKLNLSPEMYSLQLLNSAAAPGAAVRHAEQRAAAAARSAVVPAGESGDSSLPASAREKIKGWVEEKRKEKTFISDEYTLANSAAALMLGWDGTGGVPDEVQVKELADSPPGRNIKKVYTALVEATAFLQLKKLERDRWPVMKRYMGMATRGETRREPLEVVIPVVRPNVWCLQEMDAYFSKLLKKESSYVDFHGFGDEAPAGKDCVVAWRKDLWKKATGISPGLTNAVIKLNKKGGPSAAVVLQNKKRKETCIFVSVHLKSGTGDENLKKRITELSKLSLILVSMIDIRGAPSIVIGMDANDPRGDILLRKAVQVAKKFAQVEELEALMADETEEEKENKVENELRKLCGDYDGGKSTESGAFGDGLQPDTPWLPNFEIKRGPVVPSDHRYVMADPGRRFVSAPNPPPGNFDLVRDPDFDFKAARKKELAAALVAWKSPEAIEGRQAQEAMELGLRAGARVYQNAVKDAQAAATKAQSDRDDVGVKLNALKDQLATAKIARNRIGKLTHSNGERRSIKTKIDTFQDLLAEKQEEMRIAWTRVDEANAVMTKAF